MGCITTRGNKALLYFPAKIGYAWYMEHDELLAKINYDIEGNPYDEYMSALRAVVELHKPQVSSFDDTECAACSSDELSVIYPCPTIKAIEKELS
jgi:hypothetical protein